MNEAGGSRDPRAALRRVWRYRWILLAILIALPALAFAISSLLPKTYAATVTVEAQTGGSTATTLGGTSVTVSQGALQLVETEPVAKRVLEKLGEPPSGFEDLLEDVSARLSPLQSRSSQVTQLFEIRAEADTPQRAATIANTFAETVGEIRTERAVERIDDAIETLETQANPADTALEEEQRAAQVQELEALRASQGGTTTIVGPATPPEDPASPQPARDTVVGFVVALLIVAALVPLLLRFDRRLRETEELEEITGAPLLATIPASAFPGRAPRPGAREAFETLRASLTYFNVDRPLSSVLVASPSRGDGKTTVAVNLAIALARAAQDVVLLDCDLRRPQAAERLGLEQHRGLDAVLVGGADPSEALDEVDVGGGRLRVLSATSGAPNASVLLGSQAMATLLERLSAEADMVVIDTAPLLAVSDALPLFGKVSGAILVARLNQTRRDHIERARGLIDAAGGDVLGVVATDARSGADDYGYYGYGDEDAEPSPAAVESEATPGNGRPDGRRLGLFGRRSTEPASPAAERDDAD